MWYRIFLTSVWGIVGSIIIGHVLLAGIDVLAGQPDQSITLAQQLDNAPNIDAGITESSESAALRLAQETAAPVGLPWWIVGIVWVLIVVTGFGVITWVMRGESSS